MSLNNDVASLIPLVLALLIDVLEIPLVPLLITELDAPPSSLTNRLLRCGDAPEVSKLSFLFLNFPDISVGECT